MKPLYKLGLLSSLLLLPSFVISADHQPEIETHQPTIIEIDHLFETDQNIKRSPLVISSPHQDRKDTTLFETIVPNDVLNESTKLRKIMGDDAFLQDIKLQDVTRKHEESEPTWEPIVAEYAVTGYRVKECCLRVIRSTRHSAEDACRALGRKVWAVESNRPKITEKPYRY